MESITKNMTCIICPRGCLMTVTKNGSDITVEGNGCARGKAYAQNELTNPVRTVTSVVAVENRKDTMVSVKTSEPIPKDKIFEVMDIILSLKATAPISVGDVLKADVFGADIVATKCID